MQIPDVTNNSAVPGRTVLTCSGSGNPLPTFRWTNLTGDIEVTGTTFTVEANTFYVLTCTATNTVTHSDGSQRTCSDSYTVVLTSKFLAVCCIEINSKVVTSSHITCIGVVT